MALTIDSELADVLPCALRSVVRVDGVDRRMFDEEIRPAEVPVIIEGAMSDWAALETWHRRERLAELVGADETIYCRRIAADTDTYAEDFFPKRFGDFLDEVYDIEDTEHYLTQALVFEPVGLLRKVARTSYPGLLQNLFVDCGIPPFMREDELAEGILWMGSGGQVTPLHYDPVENLNCMVIGRKRWVMFPPDEAHNLLIDGADGTKSMLSSLDELIDGRSWRGGRVSNAFEAITQPGDIMYVPSGFSHHVFSSREPSAAINYWFIELGKLATYRSYAHWQSVDRFGYSRTGRRRLYAAGLVAGLLALQGLYRLNPRFIPTPEIELGDASYDRGAAT